MREQNRDVYLVVRTDAEQADIFDVFGSDDFDQLDSFCLNTVDLNESLADLSKVVMSDFLSVDEV